MEIDVRKGNVAIDSIRYSDGMKLTGGETLPNIKIENTAGNASFLCRKDEIPDLIKALQLAIKTWS